MLIFLDRKLSSKITVSDSLLRRGELNNEQRRQLEVMLWQCERGFEGEQRADRYWHDLQLDVPHVLLHGYETENKYNFSHQIDTILITNRFLLIVELKNIGGVISYDERTNQFVRILHGERLALTDPFAQVSRHESLVERVLWDVGVELPILTAVIITSSSSIIEMMPPHFQVFKLSGLRLKLHDWLKSYPVRVSNNMVFLIKDELLKKYKIRKWKHPFGKIPIRSGALCKCGSVMYYSRGRFVCACGQISREALLQGLHDYRLLINEWITNKELREFFLIDSADVANKLLTRAGFYYEGSNKGRRYLIPETVWRKKHEK
ncbi:nuclease-related domain-containing protein [Solibacillus sp. CAU 1738]|uniref:nuclease-related domain-containing protein n=1 Tax=Solibacillus sp. CAU 1738 TaxID=3140363 RepID=UPI0032606F26